MNDRRRPAPDLSVIREEIRSIGAYAVPDSTGLVKLDAMENPFTLPPEVARELGERLSRAALNRYPPADPRAFKEKLARAIGLPGDMALLLGNGSDELIHLTIQACARPGATVLSPWPSFEMYDLSSRFDGCRFVAVALAADFSLPRDRLLSAIGEHRPAVISGGARRGLPAVRAGHLAAGTGAKTEPPGAAHLLQAGAGRHPPRLPVR